MASINSNEESKDEIEFIRNILFKKKIFHYIFLILVIMCCKEHMVVAFDNDKIYK
jgi:hypothetical protein